MDVFERLLDRFKLPPTISDEAAHAAALFAAETVLEQTKPSLDVGEVIDVLQGRLQKDPSQCLIEVACLIVLLSDDSCFNEHLMTKIWHEMLVPLLEHVPTSRANFVARSVAKAPAMKSILLSHISESLLSANPSSNADLSGSAIWRILSELAAEEGLVGQVGLGRALLERCKRGVISKNKKNKKNKNQKKRAGSSSGVVGEPHRFAARFLRHIVVGAEDRKQFTEDIWNVAQVHADHYWAYELVASTAEITMQGDADLRERPEFWDFVQTGILDKRAMTTRKYATLILKLAVAKAEVDDEADKDKESSHVRFQNSVHFAWKSPVLRDEGSDATNKTGDKSKAITDDQDNNDLGNVDTSLMTKAELKKRERKRRRQVMKTRAAEERQGKESKSGARNGSTIDCSADVWRIFILAIEAGTERSEDIVLPLVSELMRLLPRCALGYEGAPLHFSWFVVYFKYVCTYAQLQTRVLVMNHFLGSANSADLAGADPSGEFLMHDFIPALSEAFAENLAEGVEVRQCLELIEGVYSRSSNPESMIQCVFRALGNTICVPTTMSIVLSFLGKIGNGHVSSCGALDDSMVGEVMRVFSILHEFQQPFRSGFIASVVECILRLMKPPLDEAEGKETSCKYVLELFIIALDRATTQLSSAEENRFGKQCVEGSFQFICDHIDDLVISKEKLKRLAMEELEKLIEGESSAQNETENPYGISRAQILSTRKRGRLLRHVLLLSGEMENVPVNDSMCKNSTGVLEISALASSTPHLPCFSHVLESGRNLLLQMIDLRIQLRSSSEEENEQSAFNFVDAENAVPVALSGEFPGFGEAEVAKLLTLIESPPVCSEDAAVESYFSQRVLFELFDSSKCSPDLLQRFIQVAISQSVLRKPPADAMIGAEERRLWGRIAESVLQAKWKALSRAFFNFSGTIKLSWIEAVLDGISCSTSLYILDTLDALRDLLGHAVEDGSCAEVFELFDSCWDSLTNMQQHRSESCAKFVAAALQPTVLENNSDLVVKLLGLWVKHAENGSDLFGLHVISRSITSIFCNCDSRADACRLLLPIAPMIAEMALLDDMQLVSQGRIPAAFYDLINSESEDFRIQIAPPRVWLDMFVHNLVDKIEAEAELAEHIIMALQPLMLTKIAYIVYSKEHLVRMRAAQLLCAALFAVARNTSDLKRVEKVVKIMLDIHLEVQHVTSVRLLCDIGCSYLAGLHLPELFDLWLSNAKQVGDQPSEVLSMVGSLRAMLRHRHLQKLPLSTADLAKACDFCFRFCFHSHVASRGGSIDVLSSIYNLCGEMGVLEDVMKLSAGLRGFVAAYGEKASCAAGEFFLDHFYGFELQDFVDRPDRLLHDIPFKSKVPTATVERISILQIWRSIAVSSNRLSTVSVVDEALSKELALKRHAQEEIQRAVDALCLDADNETESSVGKGEFNSERKDFQTKISSWHALNAADDDSGAPNHAGKRQELVVCASLLEKPPNLGGLTRTCEVFQVAELILPSPSVLRDPAFSSLAVTADRWAPLSFTSNSTEALKSLISEYKARNFDIVALEQTHNSVPIHEFSFAPKTFLLLGNERSGVPAELLHDCEMAIEIPQFGKIRSLNVHVSSAIAVWSYTRQVGLQ